MSEREKVIAPIMPTATKMLKVKPAKLTPTASASMLVATACIIKTLKVKLD